MARTVFRSRSALRLAAVMVALPALLLGGTAARAQDPALKRLNESPRHHEWTAIEQGGRTLKAFVVFPEVAEKALAVLVIHENRGLTDWVRGVADQVAEAGYIAIAPDLLSGMGPNGGGTAEFADTNAARDALYAVPQEQLAADLQAVADYVVKLPACNGKLAVAGFCWGGMQAFQFATRRGDLAASCVFYGSPPENAEDLQKIGCPVYGFYGGNDARINATIPETEKRMADAGKTYEAVTYEGAGHGFMRSGEDAGPDDPNRKARDQAWERWKGILKKHCCSE